MRKMMVTLVCLLALNSMGIVLGLLIEYYDTVTMIKIISFFGVDIIVIGVCMYYLAQEWDPEDSAGNISIFYEEHVPEHKEVPKDKPKQKK